MQLSFKPTTLANWLGWLVNEGTVFTIIVPVAFNQN
jgi:hypothetical protein